MKKIFCIAVLFALIASCASAIQFRIIRIGMLAKMNATEAEFSDEWKKTFAPRNEILRADVKFYNTLTEMQMALEAGQVQQMVLPESVANYVLTHNKNVESFMVLPSPGMGLAFGFLEENKKLRDEFNEALKVLRDDFTLSAIEAYYITATGDASSEPVEFKKFENAETVRVAVTGDLPPIDFIAPDGTPAGYNTAVLSEIAQYLKKNIELVNIEAGTRSAALASKRVDVVFWYEIDTTGKNRSDIPDGVILSDPYYTWHKFLHLKKAEGKKEARGTWNYHRDFLNLYMR